MGLRKQIEDYCSLASRQGYQWIADGIPPSATTKTAWKCKRGHVWSATFSNIAYGSGCPKCSGKMKKTGTDYIELARKMEFVWLGPLPNSVSAKTGWKCHNGHIWSTTFHSVYHGHGCHQCSGRARIIESDYREVGRSRDLQWLGPFPINSVTKTQWRCSQGHIWLATYHTVKKSGCLQCYHNGKRLSELDYRKLAQEKNLEWIGPLPKNIQTKTLWRCNRGHLRLADYDSVKRYNCKQCHYMDYRGDKNPNFRGGDAIKRHYGDGFGLKERRAIKTRDNFTCMLMGKYLGNGKQRADVHHIIPARISPSNWKNSTHNLITLSQKSHAWAESHLEESIPLLRKILYNAYGYDFSSMNDYDLARLHPK